MELTELENQLLSALKATKDHLEYCVYGNSWKRTVPKLSDKIDAAIKAAHKKTNGPKLAHK